MIFNSWVFIIFFLIVLFLHNLPFGWKTKKLNLLVASYIFYAAWNPPFVAVLWFTTVVDWFVARKIATTHATSKRRLLLLISLAGNLGLLAYFKYGTFLLETFVSVLATLGIQFHPAAPSIILPVGISFYTFVTLSYTIDVYRGELAPSKSFLDFALLVTFFPHLVAGPILRAEKFLPQCLEPKRATSQQLGWGSALMLIGLFEKIVLADGALAPVADQVYNSVSKAGTMDAWVGTLAFSGQIFFDFDGYSLCAIGAAMCLGFAFPDNFRFPYAAIGFSDFWRRWHISLSSWLRDYLYVSLGGNRRGRVRTYVNLTLTMLIGGLWHGAAWRFVIWGGLHGSYLVVERLIRGIVARYESVKRTSVAVPAWAGEAQLAAVEQPGMGATWSGAAEMTAIPSETVRSAMWERVPVRAALAVLTYFLVCLTWVFFRARDLKDASRMILLMFSGASSQLSMGSYEVFSALIITVGLLTMHWLLRDSSLEQAIGRVPMWLRAVVFAALIWAIAVAPGDDRAFIYFQF